jgi:hypothetical protein
MPVMRAVQSSWVAAIGYEEKAHEVHVALIEGRAYAYESVSSDVWELFLAAESKGTFVNQVLKPRYEVREL